MKSKRLIISNELFQQYTHFKNGDIDYMIFKDKTWNFVFLLCNAYDHGYILVHDKLINPSALMVRIMKDLKNDVAESKAIYMVSPNLNKLKSFNIGDIDILPVFDCSKTIKIFCDPIFGNTDYSMEIVEDD